MDELPLKAWWLTVLPVRPGPGKRTGDTDKKTRGVRCARCPGAGSGEVEYFTG